jgi:hypothetical protein
MRRRSNATPSNQRIAVIAGANVFAQNPFHKARAGKLGGGPAWMDHMLAICRDSFRAYFCEADCHSRG